MIQTTMQRWTKQDERKFLADAEKERYEAERNLPADRQHVEPAWLAAFWLARQVLR